MLEKEFKYYVDHQAELVEKYQGKYLVIRGEEVVAVYDDEIEAYTEAVKKYELGTFMLQECQPGKENYTRTFRHRITF